MENIVKLTHLIALTARHPLLRLSLMLAMVVSSGSHATSEQDHGEYILSRDFYQNPVCKAFTRNLNQFRKVPFETCNPRLSAKFPEFSRPEWKEIPYDIGVAERWIRGWGKSWNSDDDERWQNWLKANPDMATSGRARMWSTRIDLDGDGKVETVYRMHPSPTELYPLPARTITPPQNPLAECDYNRGTLRLGDDARKEVANQFNQGARGSDLIHFVHDKRYYIVQWTSGYPADFEIGTKIGATAGVVLSRLDWNLDHISTGPECKIEWVPTGRYRPLKRKPD